MVNQSCIKNDSQATERHIGGIRRHLKALFTQPVGDPWINALVRDYFCLLLLVVLLMGISLLLLSYICPPGTIRRELIRDLGIATIISFIVTAVIERYTARRREADIRSGVFEAVMRSIMPAIVWEEIRSNIVASQVLCESWSATLVLSKERVKISSGIEEDKYVATGSLTYSLRNGLARDQVIELSHELISDVEGHEAKDENPLPRFISLHADAVNPATQGQIAYEGNALKEGGYVRGALLRVPMRLLASPSPLVQVGLTRKEIIVVPGGYPWFMVWVTLNPRIAIESRIEGLKVRVLARHPNERLLQEVSPGKVWQFNGVMLPGQGLEILLKGG